MAAAGLGTAGALRVSADAVAIEQHGGPVAVAAAPLYAGAV